MTRITEHNPKIFEDETSMIPIGDKCCKEVCKMLNDSIIDKDIIAEHCISINALAEKRAHPGTTSGMVVCKREQKKAKILKDMRLTLKEKGICKCVE
jgi:hypothetical protein